MKIKVHKTLLLIINFILFCNTTIFSVVIKGSLVNTPSGFVPIENLRMKDFVIGYCLDCKNFVKSPIIKIEKKRVDKIFLITTEKEDLIVSKCQLFFDPMKKKWFSAKHLTAENYLVSCNLGSSNITFSKVRCYGVKKIKKRTSAYKIELGFPHTFFISNSQILTHNFALSLTSLGAYFTFGLGSVSLKSIGIGITILGIGVVNFFTGKSKNKNHIIFNPSTLNNLPNDPDDEDNKNKEEEFKISEDDAPHMFEERKGHFSDTPLNRKKLLDLVSDPDNFLGIDMYGKRWYNLILSNGKQLWAYVRGKLIRNGGLNEVPLKFHPKTGLSKPFRPRFNKPKF